MVYKNFSSNLHIYSGFSFLPPGERAFLAMLLKKNVCYWLSPTN